jgi:hypothetical protein
MDDISWSAVETVRSFYVERAACPGLTSLEWAQAVADRLANRCELHGEALCDADREQLAWLIGQHLESSLSVMPGLEECRPGYAVASRARRTLARAVHERRRSR